VADPGIKKVVINKKDLPPISGEQNGYIVRYRISSEDKNRYSHWSPQHRVLISPPEQIPFSLTVDSVKNTVSLIWNVVEGISSFDVYIKINGGPWVYSTTSLTNSYSTIAPSSATSVQIAVQIPTYPKQRYDDATLFVTNSTAI
jgi:hypothetical protein